MLKHVKCIEEGLLASETLHESADAVSVTLDGFKVIAAVCIMRPEIAAVCRTIFETFESDDLYDTRWVTILAIAAPYHFQMIGDEVAINLMKQIRHEAKS